MYKKYRRTNIAEMRPFEEGDKVFIDCISISESDKKNGSPKIGDMIARNPANYEDKWLVAKDCFMANFEEI